MIQGRIKKYLKEVCVETQPLVKNPQISIGALIQNTSNELGVDIEFKSFYKFQF